MVAAQNGPLGLRARRVLLVEDNPDVGRACRNILTLRGHHVFLASDGVEALEIARAEPLDVVLCDLAMPEMDGFEVARALRANPLTAKLPICALTAYGYELCDRALRAGFDKVLLKPAPLWELYGFVEAA